MATGRRRAYLGAMSRDLSPSRRKVLNWLREEEREVCVRCGERARVDLPLVSAWFCLACGGSSVEGASAEQPETPA
jgi:ribosomal protein L37AE/L43A